MLGLPVGTHLVEDLHVLVIIFVGGQLAHELRKSLAVDVVHRQHLPADRTAVLDDSHQQVGRIEQVMPRIIGLFGQADQDGSFGFLHRRQQNRIHRHGVGLRPFKVVFDPDLYLIDFPLLQQFPEQIRSMPSLLLQDSQKQVVKRKALCPEVARLGIALFEHGPQGVCLLQLHDIIPHFIFREDNAARLLFSINPYFASIPPPRAPRCAPRRR